MPVLDWAMLVVGTVIGIIAVTADLIGVGRFQGFGWKQGLGVALALILVSLGAVRIVRRDKRARP